MKYHPSMPMKGHKMSNVTHAELAQIRKSAHRSAKLTISRGAKRKGNAGTPNYGTNLPGMTDAKLVRYIRSITNNEISAYGLKLAIKRINRLADSGEKIYVQDIVRDIMANS
jgi:hypothetical protein